MLPVLFFDGCVLREHEKSRLISFVDDESLEQMLVGLLCCKISKIVPACSNFSRSPEKLSISFFAIWDNYFWISFVSWADAKPAKKTKIDFII